MQTELGLSTLHKTLKDPTRQKIILALSERASLSYTDLMTTLQIDSTGKLNYHLKILNGLISKDADGRYFLTEKGKTAAQLLRQFPDVDKRRLQFWIVAGLAQAAFLISVIALYYFNYTSFAAMVQGLIVGTFAMVLTYLLYKAQGVQLVHGSSTEHHAIQVAYITGGACIAGLIVFLGGAFLLGSPQASKQASAVNWSLGFMVSGHSLHNSADDRGSHRVPAREKARIPKNRLWPKYRQRMISQRKRLSAREVAKAETANKLANIKEAIKGY